MAEQFLTLMADLDPDAQARLAGWYDLLKSAGFTGTQTPGLPYHISLTSFPTSDETEAVAITRRAAERFAPVSVHLSHIGLFAGGRILFAAPERNPELDRLEEACRSAAPQRHPWTPHTTLLIDEPDRVHAALPVLLGAFVPFVARITRLHLCAFWPTREIVSADLRAAAAPDRGIRIRRMEPSDAPVFTQEEIAQGWNADITKYRMRLEDQAGGKCVSLTAEYDGRPAGYIHIYRKSQDGPFLAKGWPEIVDFGVLVKYRGKGIGTQLMDAAEQIAGEWADTVCLAVGLHNGYGSAQRMYVRRGYVPDGSGVWYRGRPCTPYDTVYTNDDDMVLFLSKKLHI